MKHRNLFINLFAAALIVFYATGISSCSNSGNYKEAYGINVSEHKFIKLLAERQPIVHSPGDLLAKTYKDSILIPAPSFESGIIHGKDVPVPKGYYNYLGTITINGNDLKVDLLFDNTDDKKPEQFGWNGNYKLSIK
jgi:hypothetical protein